MDIYIYTFYIYLVASTVLFLLPQPRRKNFPLRFVLIFLAGMFCVACARHQNGNGYLRNMVSFTLALGFMTLLSHGCFRITWSEAVFCAIGGYSVQFIQSTLAEMVERSIPGAQPYLELLKLISALIILPLCYFLFCRKLKKGQNVDISKRPLLLLLLAAVLIEIILCYNLRQEWKITTNTIYLLSDCILIIICSFCLLTIQFTLLRSKNLETELAIQQQMLRKEQNQYQISKEIIDTVNRKCHDMRHQIHTIGRSASLDPTALEEMEDSISIYDALYQTGNKALDIILAEKALLCQNNDIVISCMADGAKLNFMSDTDIYSLFGNLLENAIHAVQELEPDRKLIGLVIKSRGAMLTCSAYNCYTGDILFENGLPVTGSTDTMNRGFGVKSIVMIVRKYGGTVTFQAKDGLFNINILFPLNDEI